MPQRATQKTPFYLSFLAFTHTKQQKSCSAAPHQWCDAIERADAFSAMIASPQPVVRLFRGQSFAWLLHRAAALSRCAASSLLSASIRRANCTRSRPSPTLTVWSIAASSEGLCMRTDSCAIEMLVGRRSLASDCICSCSLRAASRGGSEPLATSDGSTATRAGARCTQKVSHARGHVVARRAVRHGCRPQCRQKVLLHRPGRLFRGCKKTRYTRTALPHSSERCSLWHIPHQMCWYELSLAGRGVWSSGMALRVAEA